MKFPKDIICSEDYGKFNLVNFGYAFKALADLTSETTLEQKADKLRKDATQVIKEGCRDKGSLPSYFIFSLSCNLLQVASLQVCGGRSIRKHISNSEGCLTECFTTPPVLTNGGR